MASGYRPSCQWRCFLPIYFIKRFYDYFSNFPFTFFILNRTIHASPVFFQKSFIPGNHSNKSLQGLDILPKVCSSELNKILPLRPNQPFIKAWQSLVALLFCAVIYGEGTHLFPSKICICEALKIGPLCNPFKHVTYTLLNTFCDE